MYGRLFCTYESASTRRFRYGRVDCIRSATEEAHAWAQTMCQAEPAGESDNDIGKKVTFNLHSVCVLYESEMKSRVENDGEDDDGRMQICLEHEILHLFS